MITQHPLDNYTILRAIELIDRYMFVLQKDKSDVGQEHLKYISTVLHNLRNALKFNAQVLIEDDQAYQG